MVQIYGSGLKGYANTALVDDTGHLYVISTLSGIPQVGISGGINIGSVHASVDTVYIQSGANISLTVSLYDTGSRGAILSGVNTLLMEHTVTTASIYNLAGFDLTGTADGKFSLLENNTLIVQYRTNAAEQNVKKNFTNPLRIATGSIMVFVEHGESLSQGFQGAIYGYETS